MTGINLEFLPNKELVITNYFSPSDSSKESAPLGHSFTCRTISKVIEPSGRIHGFTRGSKTSGNPRKQFPQWIQSEGFQTTVTSPFEYFLIIFINIYSFSGKTSALYR
jgi:hypothetical protein